MRGKPKTTITFDDEGSPVVKEENMKPYHRQRIAAHYAFQMARDAALTAFIEPALGFHSHGGDPIHAHLFRESLQAPNTTKK